MRQSHLKSAKDSLKRRITTEKFTLIKNLSLNNSKFSINYNRCGKV